MGNFPNARISIPHLLIIQGSRVLPQWPNTLPRRHLRQIRAARANVTCLRGSAPFPSFPPGSFTIGNWLSEEMLYIQEH